MNLGRRNRHLVFWGLMGLVLQVLAPPYAYSADPPKDDFELLFPDLNNALKGSSEPLHKRRALSAETRASVKTPIRFAGYVREEAAFRISEPMQLTKLRTLGFVSGTGALSPELSYKVSGRFWYDAVYDLTDHYPQPVADDQTTDLQLRDAYIDYSHGNFDIRTGKQQIVWGEAIALFYADVVNALDLREFILPEFDLIRIPEWAVDAEYSYEHFHAEGIWLPFPEMDRVARPGADFAPNYGIDPQTPFRFGHEQKPVQSIENGEAGGRLSYRAAGWDLSVFHLRTWEKAPIYEISADPNGLILTATHPRLTIDGFTLAKEIDNVIWKTEAAYSWNRHFQTLAPEHPNGVADSDYLNYLVGADRTFKKLDTSIQVSESWIRDFEPGFVQPERIQVSVSLFARYHFMRDRLLPECTIVKDVASTDLLARPRIAYKPGEHWQLTTGFDVFSGPKDHLFGQYRAQNRVYTHVSYFF